MHAPAVNGEAPKPGVTRRTPPYEIVLTRSRRLVFDHDGAGYRVAWYELRRQPCEDCKGTGFPRHGLGLCTQCHGRRFQMRTTRTVGRAAELHEAISAARDEREISLDSMAIAEYVFATEWGCGLPGVRPLQQLEPFELVSPEVEGGGGG